jgi:predicted nucleotidyltransferase
MNENKIEELKNYVISDLNPEAIILFGSYARGTQTADSDLDFLAVVDDVHIKNIDVRRSCVLIPRKVSAPRPSTDLIIKSRSEFNYWKNSMNNLVGRAVAEGKVIYERPQSN